MALQELYNKHFPILFIKQPVSKHLVHNICSLQGSFENLQYLVNNQDHSFSFISVSEAWNQKSKSEQVNPEILEGYQKYYGINGNSLKSDCWFYVRKDIKLNPRNELNLNQLELLQLTKSCR